MKDLQTTVIFQGPFFSNSGYGAHARDLVLGLNKHTQFNIVGLPVGWGRTSQTTNFNDDDVAELLDIASHAHPNPDENIPLLNIQVGIPPEFRRIGKNQSIGITAGMETTKLPDGWADAVEQNCTALIVPSTFVQNQFRQAGVTIPVYVIGEGVRMDLFNPKLRKKVKEQLTLAETNTENEVTVNLPQNVIERFKEIKTDFNYLIFGQWTNTGIAAGDRKGIEKGIEAFIKAFKGNTEDVGLVIKTNIDNNSSLDKHSAVNLIQAVIKQHCPLDQAPPVYLIHGNMTDEEVAGMFLHPKIKAYISLTSGEGWNRPLAQAVGCGLPVITTGWSGQMDYLDHGTQILVKHKLVDVPVELIKQLPQFYVQGAKWAQPDIETAVECIHKSYTEYDTYVEKAVLYTETFFSRFSKNVTDNAFVELVDKFAARCKQSVITAKDTVTLTKV